jgi:hypothetical protein
MDRSHPLAQGLVAFWALNEGTGAPTDAVAGLGTSLLGGATWGAGASGHGLRCTALGAGAYAILPPSLQLPYPLTIACGYRYLGGTPTGNANIFALESSATGSPINNIRISWNLGGTAITADVTTVAYLGSYLPAVGSEVALGLSVVSSNVISLYAGGQSVASTSSGGAAAPTWTPTGCACIGQIPAISSRTAQGIVTWAGAWSRALSATEHAALASNPWQTFAPPRDAARLTVAASGRRVSYSRGSSALRPLQLSTSDLHGYRD